MDWERALVKWRKEMRAAGLSTGTIRVRWTHLHQFAGHHPAGPRTVTRDDLIDWLALDRSPEYRRSVRSSLSTFFTWAQDVGLVRTSPARRLPKVRVPSGVPRPADDEVIVRALAAAPARTVLMVRLMAELGLRRAETAAADTRHVELAGLRVHCKGRERVVPLPRDLRSLLGSLPAGPVFPGRIDGHLSAGYVGKLVGQVLPDGVVPHQLRHAAASAWHALGLDLAEIRVLLGHASVATTQRYVLTRSEQARQTVEAAAARFRPAPPARRAAGM
jgi:integrase